MAGSFEAQIDAWVRQTKERVQAVRDESTQRVIAAMQEPGPSRATVSKAISTGAGLGKTKKDGARGVSRRAFGPISNPGGAGNLPVDTGFLRASLVVGSAPLNAPVTTPPKDGGSATWDAAVVTLALNNADLSDVVEARYTAAYARRIEYGFTGTDSLGRSYSQRGTRFVALAAQQWPQIVAAVAAETKSKAGA
jgi:hypothetical protein